MENGVHYIGSIFAEVKTVATNAPVDKTNPCTMMPILDRALIQQFQHSKLTPEDSLSTIGFNFPINMEWLAKILKSGIITDQFAICIFLQTVAACYVELNNLTPEMYALLMPALTLCIQTKYATYVDFCFASLLTVAHKLDNFDWTYECIATTFQHIMANKTMTSSNYECVADFLLIVSSRDNKNDHDQVFGTLITLFSEERPLIRGQDLGFILRLLMPFCRVMDLNALGLLSLMSNSSSSHEITEVFRLLPEFMLNVITSREPAFGRSTEPTEKPWVVEEKLPEFNFEFIEKDYKSFPDGMNYLCPELSKYGSSMYDMLSKEIQMLVMNIGCFLSKCSKCCFDAFFNATAEILKTRKDSSSHYFDLYAAFVFLLDKCHAMNDAFKCLVCNPVFFNPGQSVFQDCNIKLAIKVLRNEVITLLSDRQIISMLINASKYPLLFCEILGRVMLKGKPSLEYVSDVILRKILENAVILQRMELETKDSRITAARGVTFQFLFALGEQAGANMFVTYVFTRGFLRFLFEEDLSDMILTKFTSLICEDMNITYAIKFFENIIKKTGSDPRYMVLCTKITRAASIAMRSLPAACEMFRPLIFPFLDLATPETKDINEYLLDMIYLTSRDRTAYKLTPKLIQKMAAILVPDERSLKLIYRFIGLNGNEGLIEYPKFIPLLFMIFGDTAYFEGILRYLNDLADHSDHNKAVMHDGSVDVFLLKLLCDITEFSYYGVKMRLREVDRKLLGKLLSKICCTKSDFFVTHSFNEFLMLHPDEASTLMISIANSTTAVKHFGLSTNEYVREINGIEECLNSSFTLNVQAKLDGALMARTNAMVHLVRFTDPLGMKLSFYFNRSSLFCEFVRENGKNTVVLVNQISTNKVHQFKIKVTAVPDQYVYTISVQYDGKGQVPTQIIRRTFSPPICVTMGGLSNAKYIDKSVMAVLTKLDLEAESMTLDLLTGVPKNKKNLFDCYCEDHNVFMRMFSGSVTLSDKILFLLKHFFVKNTTSQKTFRCGYEFVDLVRKQNLNYHLYLMFYSVFMVITDDTLRMTWFERIILNMRIWSRCSVEDSINIINHWSTIVLRREKAFFEKKSYFTELILQMNLLYPFDSKESENDRSQELVKVRSHIINFIKRVGHIHLAPEDVINICAFCSSCELLEQKQCFMEIIRDCAKPLMAVKPAEFDIISAIMRHIVPNDGDDELVVVALQALHELIGPSIHFYSNVLCLTSPLLKRAPRLFQRLTDILPSYPNLTSICSCLALQINAANVIAHPLTVALSDDRFKTTDFWYLWPVLVAGRTDNTYQWKIIDGIVAVLERKGTLEQEAIRMFHLISFIYAGTDLDLSFTFLRSVVERTGMVESKLMHECFLNCARLIFFKFTTRNHSVKLLKRLARSPFGLPDEFRDAIAPKTMSIKHISDLSMLFDVDPSTVKLNFEMHLDQSGSTLDSEKFKLSLALGLYLDPNQMELQAVRNIITHFAKRVRTPANMQLASMNVIQSCVNKMKNDYLDEFQRHLRAILPAMKEYFGSVVDHFESIVKNIQWTQCDTQFLQEMMEWENSHKVYLLGPQERKERLVRDSTLCAGLYPGKMKISRRVPRDRSELSRNPYGYNIGCKRIQFDRIESYSFRIGDSYVMFIHSGKVRVVPFDTIEYILTRSSTSFEIFTCMGKTYYFDFAPTDIETIINRIPQQKLTSLNDSSVFSVEHLKEEFASRPMSNFEYIMKMNIACGRSFNLSDNYPVFPSILFDVEDPTQVGIFDQLAPPSITVDLSLTLPPVKGKELKSLAESIEGLYTIAPEFYYFTKLTTPNGGFPDWAKSATEFVYKHRALLETSTISRCLPRWIEKTFGVSNHPVKAKMQEIMVIDHISLINDAGRGLIFADCISEAGGAGCVTYAFVFANGDIEISEVSVDLTQKCNIISTYHIDLESPIIRSGDSYLLISDGREHHRISSTGITKLDVAPGAKIVATKGNNIVSMKSSSQLFLNNKVMLCSSDRICAVNIGFSFSIIAISTADGHLVVVSLTNGREVWRASMDGEIAQEIVVTDSIGFIVVLTSSHLWIFDVNGVFVKKCANDCGIQNMYAFSSPNKLDYVCFMDEHGVIKWFEAMYPETRKVLLEAKDAISTHYLASCNCMITISQNGVINFSPVRYSS